MFIGIASLVHPKAKLMIQGRKRIFEKLEKEELGGHQVVWVHCASLGEFEQARPVIEAIRKQHQKYKILLTFFSPSGYEIRKNYEGADWVYYLPFDTPANAKRFNELVKPAKVLFVKYEFWHNFLSELKNKNIPVYLFSAIFRENQPFFKNYTSFYKDILKCFEHLFVQDDNSIKLLNSIEIENVTKAGDTRFDRVIEIAENVNELPDIKKFKGDNFLMIIGSAWSEDLEAVGSTLVRNHLEANIDKTHNGRFKLLIAPHEINKHAIFAIQNELGYRSLRYSEWDKESLDFDVLILDTMGMLSSVYQYADLVMIGGGFGKGIHNTLEAAVYGVPLTFGVFFDKFKEAKDLIEVEAAFPVGYGHPKFSKTMKQFIEDDQFRERASKAAKKYVYDHAGATNKIMKAIFASNGEQEA